MNVLIDMADKWDEQNMEEYHELPPRWAGDQEEEVSQREGWSSWWLEWLAMQIEEGGFKVGMVGFPTAILRVV